MRLGGFGLIVLGLLVGGCSGRGQPSEDDIRAALTLAGNRGGAQAVKLACKRSPDKPGFMCDYRAPACNRFTGRCSSPRPFSGRFVRADTRWQLVEDGTPPTAPGPATQPTPGPVEPTPPVAAPPELAPAAPSEPLPEATVSPAPEVDAPVVRPAPRPAPTFVPRRSEPPQRRDFEDDEDRPRELSVRDLGIIARWSALNTRCSIRSDSDEFQREACFERDEVAQRLRRRGLCYGGGSSRHTVAKWHRCD